MIRGYIEAIIKLKQYLIKRFSISDKNQNIENSFENYIAFSTYVIKASHSKKFSSFIGPAMIPSGGFIVNSIN